MGLRLRQPGASRRSAQRSGLEVSAIDCRALDAETVLVISHFADLPDYPAEAAAVAEFLAGLEVPEGRRGREAGRREAF